MCKASMRASERCVQTLHRQEHDKVCKVSVRVSETCEKTLHKQD